MERKGAKTQSRAAESRRLRSGDRSEPVTDPDRTSPVPDRLELNGPLRSPALRLCASAFLSAPGGGRGGTWPGAAGRRSASSSRRRPEASRKSTAAGAPGEQQAPGLAGSVGCVMERKGAKTRSRAAESRRLRSGDRSEPVTDPDRTSPVPDRLELNSPFLAARLCGFAPLRFSPPRGSRVGGFRRVRDGTQRREDAEPGCREPAMRSGDRSEPVTDPDRTSPVPDRLELNSPFLAARLCGFAPLRYSPPRGGRVCWKTARNVSHSSGGRTRRNMARSSRS